MTTTTIDPEVLAALKAAGITEEEAARYAEGQEQAYSEAVKTRAHARTLADAVSALAKCKAPASLLAAYARAGAPAASILRDLISHVDVRDGMCRLHADAVRLIEARLALVAPIAKTYFSITAAHGRG